LPVPVFVQKRANPAETRGKSQARNCAMRGLL
jgi:hypothetical protein